MKKNYFLKLKSSFYKLLVYALIASQVLQPVQVFALRVAERDELYPKGARILSKNIVPMSHRVDLQKDAQENFSINLSANSSEPCNIEYFNKDTLVAQVFCSKDEVVFQGGEKYDFIINGSLKTNK